MALAAASSRLNVHSTGQLSGQSTVQVPFNAPSSFNAAMTRTVSTGGNNLNTPGPFPAGLTEIIYIYGNAGAERTCTYRVYVLGK